MENTSPNEKTNEELNGAEKEKEKKGKKIRAFKINFSWRRIPWTEIAVTVVVAALIGFIVVPTFNRVVENADRNECDYQMGRILSELSARLASDETGFWNDLINTGTPRSILTAVKQKMGDDKIDVSEYDTERKTGEFVIYSTVYEKLKRSIAVTEYEKPQSETVRRIEGISVTGIPQYPLCAVMDKDKPEQTAFQNGDNLKKLFPNLKVTLSFSGGEKTELGQEEYSIITNGFDMSAPGEKKIIIDYDNRSNWGGDQSAVYVFNAVENDAEFTVSNGGESYKVSAWKWQNYAAAAAETDASFNAAMVEHEGVFYYYPDGFTLRRGGDNETPKKGALDENGDPAKYIKINVSSVIKNKTEETPEEGSLLIEDGMVYVWRRGASRSSRGWVRIYGQVERQ